MYRMHWFRSSISFLELWTEDLVRAMLSRRVQTPQQGRLTALPGPTESELTCIADSHLPKTHEGSNNGGWGPDTIWRLLLEHTHR